MNFIGGEIHEMFQIKFIYQLLIGLLILVPSKILSIFVILLWHLAACEYCALRRDCACIDEYPVESNAF